MSRFFQEPQVRFAVVTQGRTGSTHLGVLLDSHPSIQCYGEVFQYHGQMQFGVTDPEIVLTKHILPTEVECVGLKAPLGSFMVYPHIFDLFRQHQFRIVRLYRENPLDHFISIRMAQVSGKWGSKTDDGYGVPPITVGLDEVVGAMRIARYNDRIIRESTDAFPHFDLTYEEMINSDGIDRLLKFLDVAPAPLESPYRRQRLGSQSSCIANYDELRTALADTEWSTFFTG
ncbi:MAG: hypothetical protein C0484_16755 [Rhodospirillum sp.]|nr:hypothetical protein [Rhodospirillum sp.]